MQIPLALTPKLLYAADNFVVHTGVGEAIESCKLLAASTHYGIALITGSARSGKSHLAVYLMDQLARLGHYPRLVDGPASFECVQEVPPDEVTIVDNLGAILEHRSSSDFVAFVEQRRISGAKVLLLAREAPQAPQFDEHIMSRLRSALPVRIGPPSDAELPLVFDAIARQRGFALTPRNVQFLMRRLRRDIASMEEYVRRLERLSLVRSMSMKRDLIHDAVG